VTRFQRVSFSISTVLWSFLAMSAQAFAEGAAVPAGSAAAAGPPAQPGFAQMAFPFILMFGVVYFLMIRPQQKKAREQESILKELKDGDEVITQSGILGTIRGMTEKVVTLEIAEKVRIKILRSQVAQVIKGNL